MNPKYFFLIPAFFLLGLVSITAQAYYGSLNYSMSAPLGDTKDYIGKYSWRGFNLDAQWFLQSAVSIGFHSGWNAFYEKTTGDFEDDTQTISGTQLRYVNAVPILFEGRYHLGVDEGRRPYFGLGVGTIRTWERTEMGIFLAETDAWQFALAPAVGVIIPVGLNNSGVNIGLRYNYAFETDDMRAHSYLGINVGIAWMGY